MFLTSAGFSCLVFLVLVLPHRAADGPYTSNAATHSRFVGRDFVPDGNLSKEVWRQAEWARFDHDMSGKRTYPQAEMMVYWALICTVVLDSLPRSR